MGLFRDTIERLQEFEFIKQSSEVLNTLNVFLYSKGYINVIIRQYTTDVNSELIISDALRVREILLKNEVNLWNTYFLIITNYKIDEEITYMIERDSRVFRKFLIRNLQDLNRIPFLDKTEVNNTETAIFPSNLMTSETKEIEKLLNFIKKNNGDIESIKQNVILDGIKKIIGLGGTLENENK